MIYDDDDPRSNKHKNTLYSKQSKLHHGDLLSFNMSLFLSGQHSGNTAHFIYQTSFDDLVTLSILKSRILVAFNACSVIEKENDSK